MDNKHTHQSTKNFTQRLLTILGENPKRDMRHFLSLALPMILIVAGVMFFSHKNSHSIDQFLDHVANKNSQDVVEFVKKYGANVRHSKTNETLAFILLRQDGFSVDLFRKLEKEGLDYKTVDFTGNNLIGKIVIYQENKNRSRLRNPAYDKRVWDHDMFFKKLDYLQTKGLEPQVQVGRDVYKLSEYVENSRFLK